MAEFFAMGGYGAFVWPAFGLSAIVLVALLVTSVRSLRASEQALAEIDRTGADGERAA
jgi:heme exporter protein D